MFHSKDYVFRMGWLGLDSCVTVETASQQSDGILYGNTTVQKSREMSIVVFMKVEVLKSLHL